MGEIIYTTMIFCNKCKETNVIKANNFEDSLICPVCGYSSYKNFFNNVVECDGEPYGKCDEYGNFTPNPTEDEMIQIQREKEVEAARLEFQRKIQEANERAKVHCPYCNSTNCKKLGAISRGVSFGLFGFGSGKIGKQWHCNSCKSDF